ncbi:MAG TPA: peptidylprolyl isomerase [Polyangiaceae bacterium]|nr:peptidylprolyl isomerase [Polyangiaceae bacterium]
MLKTSPFTSVALFVAVVSPLACQSSPPEPPPGPIDTTTAMPKSTTPAATPTPTPAPTPTPTPPPAAPKPVASVAPSADDPLKGVFTLDDATKGLPGKGSLVAELKTDMGTLSCELFDDKAPITVANFVGLARGIRPWKNPSGEWVKKPGYDGTTFHRVIKGFMIQGGDPLGTGAGEPGYVIPDEIWPGATHDHRGELCMANRGKNTNGMQFFITDGGPKHLDGGYTIFGQCGPDDLIEKLASVEVRGDRSVTPTKIEKVTIKRVASKAKK